MALLKILQYPDPRLRLKAQAIEEINDEIKTLVANMAETMYHSNGIGLAATQVDVQKRLFITDIRQDNEPSNLCVFINLEIIERFGEIVGTEGCLSVPGVYEEVYRSEKIIVRYQDMTGSTIESEFEGLPAICIQHENDHLEGKVFIDYLSNSEQEFIKKKLKEISHPN